jgi:hypothetical protein
MNLPPFLFSSSSWIWVGSWRERTEKKVNECWFDFGGKQNRYVYIVVSSFKERAILNAPYRYSFYFYILYLIFTFYYLRVIFSQIIESWPSPWIGLEFKLSWWMISELQLRFISYQLSQTLYSYQNLWSI